MKLPPLRSRADVTTNYGFFAYVIFRKRRATQPKKLQSSVSQVKRNPHGKIQLFLSTFKNSRKTRGTFLHAAFQLINMTRDTPLSHFITKLKIHHLYSLITTCGDFDSADPSSMHRLQNSHIFFANVSDGKYSNKRSGTSGKKARENGERC